MKLQPGTLQGLIDSYKYKVVYGRKIVVFQSMTAGRIESETDITPCVYLSVLFGMLPKPTHFYICLIII
jgi:hypothetical protein